MERMINIINESKTEGTLIGCEYMESYEDADEREWIVLKVLGRELNLALEGGNKTATVIFEGETYHSIGFYEHFNNRLWYGVNLCAENNEFIIVKGEELPD